eukprot:Hpha_TRINITY_DN16133_c2_g10::TRINITY_DN16133_c2_g10_i2::g.5419::m.5419
MYTFSVLAVRQYSFCAGRGLILRTLEERGNREGGLARGGIPLYGAHRAFCAVSHTTHPARKPPGDDLGHVHGDGDPGVVGHTAVDVLADLLRTLGEAPGPATDEARPHHRLREVVHDPRQHHPPDLLLLQRDRSVRQLRGESKLVLVAEGREPVRLVLQEGGHVVLPPASVAVVVLLGVVQTGDGAELLDGHVLIGLPEFADQAGLDFHVERTAVHREEVLLLPVHVLFHVRHVFLHLHSKSLDRGLTGVTPLQDEVGSALQPLLHLVQHLVLDETLPGDVGVERVDLTEQDRVLLVGVPFQNRSVLLPVPGQTLSHLKVLAVADRLHHAEVPLPGRPECLVGELVEGQRGPLVRRAEPPPLQEPVHGEEEQSRVHVVSEGEHEVGQALGEVVVSGAVAPDGRPVVHHAAHRQEVDGEGQGPEAEVELEPQKETHGDSKEGHDQSQGQDGEEQHLADGVEFLVHRKLGQVHVRQENQLKHHQPHGDRGADALVAPVVAHGLEEAGTDEQHTEQTGEGEEEPAHLVVTLHKVEVLVGGCNQGRHENGRQWEQHSRSDDLSVAPVADDPGQLPDELELRDRCAGPEHDTRQQVDTVRLVVIGGLEDQDGDEHKRDGERGSEVGLDRVLVFAVQLAGEHEQLEQAQYEDDTEPADSEVHADLPVPVVCHQTVRHHTRGDVRVLPSVGQAQNTHRHQEVSHHDVPDGVEPAALVVVGLPRLHHHVGVGLGLAGLLVLVDNELGQLAIPVVSMPELLLQEGLLPDVEVVNTGRDAPPLDQELEDPAAGAEVQEALEARRPGEHSRDDSTRDVGGVVTLALHKAYGGGDGEADADEGRELLLGPAHQLLLETRREAHTQSTKGRHVTATEEPDGEVPRQGHHHESGPFPVAEDRADDTDHHCQTRDGADHVSVHRVREEEQRCHRQQPHPASLIARRCHTELRVDLAALLCGHETVTSAQEILPDEDQRHRSVAAGVLLREALQGATVVKVVTLEDHQTILGEHVLELACGLLAERARGSADKDSLPGGLRILILLDTPVTVRRRHCASLYPVTNNA